ncbi:MAG TPA: hypothetical protein VN947_21705 [Polyangia bacterium]|nr:hypothetical protein [Polyangia bacterium]
MRTSALLGIVAAGSLVAFAPRAHAAAYDFSAGSWIIPMDACNQPSRAFNGSSFNGSNETSTIYGSASSCPEGSITGKDGVLKAYGLIYRLLQNNVPVYYILDTTKSGVDQPDLTITSTTATPVSRVTHSGGTYSTYGNTSEFMNSTHRSIVYRGAPFIISAADVPTALNLMKTNSAFTGTDSRTGRGYFDDVYIHQAKVNILQAPVRAILMQTPPKIALMDIGGAAIGVLQGYLKDAGLYTSTATAQYPSIGDVFTQFNDVTDFTTSNGLTTGGFSILWAPHWEGNYSITTTQRDQVIQKITAFIDAGHPFVAQCAAIATMEGANSPLSYGDEPASTYGHLITSATGSQVGLKTDQLSQPSFPSGTDAIQVNPSTTVQAYIDPLTQTGDFALSIDTLSWTFDFTPNTGYSYKSYVSSYVQSKTNKLQIETVAHKDGDPSKGLVIYLGGHSYGSQSSTCSGSCTTSNQYNNVGLERLILNSLIFLGQVPTSSEQTRSAPLVFVNTSKTPNVQTEYIGTYVQQSSPSSSYPPWTGHFREFSSTALVGSNVTSFNTLVDNWDAYDHVKIQDSADSGSNTSGSGRRIYTAVPVTGKMTQIAFQGSNLTKIQTVVSTATTSLINQIRQGVLGGVDHSIPAIADVSDVAGDTAHRPIVAYFGALDGMIHAILIDNNGTSTGYNPGDELWAFIPNSQLLKTFQMTGGVDGSPSIGDAYIDTSGTGQQAKWHTLLAIPDGGYAGGTLDVVDITDPINPQYLWTASDTFTSGGKTYVLGRGQGAAISPIITSSGVKFGYYFVTDNTNGTWGNGYNMYALNAQDGTVIWRVNKTYANDTTHNDVPGVAAIIDSAGDSGPVDQVYFGDIEGKVWQVTAKDGSAATNIFDAAGKYASATSQNYPIESGVVLYVDTAQKLKLIGVTSGADWVPSTTLSQVFQLELANGLKSPPGTDTVTTLATLSSGERVYAVPTISGNNVYFITSIGSLQSSIGTSFSATGNLMRVNLTGTPSATTLATVKQGASEVAVDANGNVIAASATGITQNGNSGADLTAGSGLQYKSAQKPITVRAWLDLH